MRPALLYLVLLAACADPTPWSPGVVFRTPKDPTARGFLDRRGLIHAHSVYSHDACDGKPEVDGVRDAACFDDFRRDLCAVQHDFVFLTDHRDAFNETEFPDALLYRADRGDVLVERAGGPVASWAACPDGHSALIMAGTEAGTMPVGLEGHAVPRAERNDLYGSTEAAALEAFKAKGAVVLIQHTEDWATEDLTTMPIDGFEMYNLHANTLLAAGKVLQLLVELVEGQEGMTHPDLAFLHIFSEDPIYLAKWGNVLSSGARRTTTMGTDCHRNSFPDKMQDGERIDSYRRMMSWFSNHLLVKPGADGKWDDRSLKEALKAGRLYGAFEVLGFPEGFDYRAITKDATLEMGAEITLASKPVLHVTMPKVAHLTEKRAAPALEIRLLRATVDGWEQVATGSKDVTFTPTVAGAYRAEVRMVPHHLRDEMYDEAERLLARDYVWIYSNAIYVR